MIGIPVAAANLDALLGFAGLAIGFLLVTMVYFVLLRAATLWVVKVRLDLKVATRISLIVMGVDTAAQAAMGSIGRLSPNARLAMDALVLLVTFLVASLLCGMMIRYPFRPTPGAEAQNPQLGPLNYATPSGQEGPIGSGKGALIALISLAMLVAVAIVFVVVVLAVAGTRR